MNGESVVSETMSLKDLFDLMVAKLPLWAAALVLFLVTILVAKIARNAVENKLAEKGLEEDHKEVQILGGRITAVVVMIVGLTVALKVAGIDLTTILAAGAVGIGFAMKDFIMNFLAGIMILVGRHFTIGDYISIDDTLGRVVDIQSRVTVLQAIDGTKVIVPNADLFTNKVISYTSNPFRRIEVDVGVDYRTDLENAIKVILSAARNTKGVLAEPRSSVLVREFGDSSINLKLRAWVDSKGGWIQIRSNLTLNVRKELQKYGITIPFPMRTVVYDKEQNYAEKAFVEAPQIPQEAS